MRFNLLLVWSLFFMALQCPSVAQDTLWLMNGVRIDGIQTKKDSSGVIFYKDKKNHVRAIETNECFSINHANGQIDFYYETIQGDSAFTRDEMLRFLKGRNDARLTFLPKSAIISGVLVGAGSAILLPAFGFGTILSPILPVCYAAVIGKLNVPESKLKIKKDQLTDPVYVEGFRYQARKTRLNRTLLGIGSGLLVGILASVLIYE